LVGNVGSSVWPSFSEHALAAVELHPLDRWSAEVVGAAGAELGAEACFPFGGPPYLPFQRWARKADTVFPSPIGPLIHPEYGLWHAYRGALLFAERLQFAERRARAHPCDDCAEKPCLSTCPVDAFKTGAYDVPACTRHIDAAVGRSCIEEGCLARRACPVGQEHLYDAAQAEFHMTAFLRANRGGG
jgi:ferredoxin